MSLGGRYLDSASQFRASECRAWDLGIEIEHMEVNFRAQRVDFKFSESIWVSLRRCWASGS